MTTTKQKLIEQRRKTFFTRGRSAIFVVSFYLVYLLFLFFASPKWFAPVEGIIPAQFTLNFCNILMMVPIIVFVAKEITNLCFPKNKGIFIYTVIVLFVILMGMGTYLLCAKYDFIPPLIQRWNNHFNLYLLVSVSAIVFFTIVSTLVWVLMSRHITYVGKRTRIWFPLLMFILNTFFCGFVYTTVMHGWTTFAFLMIISTCTDVFAYLGGSAFGKHKFAPNISPKKTWEGVLFGVGVTMLITCGIYGLFFIPGAEDLDHTLYRFIGCQTCAIGNNLQPYFWAIYVSVTLVIMCVSIMGDLFFSFIKRNFGIKDFSNLIPGHGGILDRLDALIFTFSFYFIVTVLLQLIMLLGFGQAEGLKFLWGIEPNFVF